MRLNASPFFSICFEKTSIESAIQLQSENRGIISRSCLKLLEYILKILRPKGYLSKPVISITFEAGFV